MHCSYKTKTRVCATPRRYPLYKRNAFRDPKRYDVILSYPCQPQTDFFDRFFVSFSLSNTSAIFLVIKNNNKTKNTRNGKKINEARDISDSSLVNKYDRSLVTVFYSSSCSFIRILSTGIY